MDQILTEIEFEEFEERYKPRFNHFEAKDNPSNDPSSCCAVNGLMYESYGRDWNYVKSQDPNKVWTVIMCDDDDQTDPEDQYWTIAKGFHIVNRMGYIITNQPWTNECPDVKY